MTPYGDDLAFIHDAGFGSPATAAAGVLLDALKRENLADGRVIDLACGSGILSAAVSEAGYDVLGIDLSEAMLTLARQRAPKARFIHGSLLSAELPPCVGVAIIGEGVNYLFDDTHSTAALVRLFQRIHEALCPGGVLLFDAAGPDRAVARAYREGDGWAVLFESKVDKRRLILTRDIVSFRRVGELYRRDAEMHRLRLFTPEDLTALLRLAGFRVGELRRYGAFTFPVGWTGFLCQKGRG